jgi:geranylgeranyl diphosphate synthase type II
VDDLKPWLVEVCEAVDAALAARVDGAWPTAFGPALRYPLFPSGKRIRPAIALAAFEAVGGSSREGAVLLAAAVELVHTYSLVHDDLPAMDDDDERRGRPSTHIAHGEATAILVGDALLTEAFAAIADAPLPAEARIQAVAALAHAAGFRGMVGGQAADVGLGGPVTDVETLTRLHAGKTGALIRASALLGGLAGGASAEALTALTTYGEAVGLAFQLADDVLDAEEDAADDGPPAFPKLLGVEETQRRAEAAMRQATAAIAALPHPERLRDLAWFAVHRTH